MLISSFGEEWLMGTFNGGKKIGLHVMNLLPNKANNMKVKEQILARIQDLPNWVLFPDFERSEWFNQILSQLWPSLEGLILSKVSNLDSVIYICQEDSHITLFVDSNFIFLCIGYQRYRASHSRDAPVCENNNIFKIYIGKHTTENRRYQGLPRKSKF